MTATVVAAAVDGVSQLPLKRVHRNIDRPVERRREVGHVVGNDAMALTCELQRMYLRQDVRGRGIGEALLKRCLAAARQFLYVRCYLETITQMQPALQFYGRNGFVALTSRMGDTGHVHNDRWMMRPLRASARHWVGGAVGF